MKRVEQQIIVSSGFGFVAYFFGAIAFFFGAVLFLIDEYELGLFAFTCGLFFIGYRDSTIVDAENKMVVQKWGLFVPFIEKRTDLFQDPTAVRMREHISKSVAYRSAHADYHIEIMTPQGNILVLETYESEEGARIMKEIAKLLGVTYYRGSNI